MRILDLFSGLGGFSYPFKERGHEVVTLDIDPRFEPDIVADVREIRYPSLSLNGEFDVVLASPPCEHFSVAGFSAGFPREGSIEAVGVVACTFRLITMIRPTFSIVENPVGLLRKIIGIPTATVTLCQYGDTRMKPTDLWGHLPIGFEARRCSNGDPCHERAPRGSKNPGTTQGIQDLAERAKLPYGLGEELCRRMEDG